MTPPPAGPKVCGGFVEALVGGGILRALVQLRAEVVAAHVEDVQEAAVPEGLLVHSHLVAFIEVDGDAEAAQGGIALRSPGAAGLAVADGLGSEDALDVGNAGAFAALELLRAFEKAQGQEVFGWSGMSAVEVGVEADGVFGEGIDDVLAAAAFEDAGFFADHLEGGVDTEGGEVGGDAQGGVVGGGLDVVLGIEPEDHVDGRGC